MIPIILITLGVGITTYKLYKWQKEKQQNG